MLPSNQHIAEYQYSQLEFPWTILTQSSKNNQILNRRFSFLDFYPFTHEEIINEPLYENGKSISNFYFLNQRPVDNINYYSRYTWTIDNSKNTEGEFIDEQWLFNKYKGWEKTTFNFTHIGKYLPVNVGYIKWGFLDNLVVNSRNTTINQTDPLDLNLNLNFSIQTSTVIINDSLIPNKTNSFDSELKETVYTVEKTFKGNFIEYIIPLGDLAYCVEVNYLNPQVECYWVDFEGNYEQPLSTGRSFIPNTHIKIIIPNIRTVEPIFNPTSSKLTQSTRGVYNSCGYLELYIYGYKIYRTINLANPMFVDSIYEVFNSNEEVNVTNPWPNYPRLPLNLKTYIN